MTFSDEQFTEMASNESGRTGNKSLQLLTSILISNIGNNKYTVPQLWRLGLQDPWIERLKTRLVARSIKSGNYPLTRILRIDYRIHPQA